MQLNFIEISADNALISAHYSSISAQILLYTFIKLKVLLLLSCCVGGYS